MSQLRRESSELSVFDIKYITRETNSLSTYNSNTIPKGQFNEGVFLDKDMFFYDWQTIIWSYELWTRQ